jgi:hypothetical protein
MFCKRVCRETDTGEKNGRKKTVGGWQGLRRTLRQSSGFSEVCGTSQMYQGPSTGSVKKLLENGEKFLKVCLQHENMLRAFLTGVY